MAERLAAALGAQLKIANFETSSAGTRAVIARPMHENAAEILRQLGGSPASFAARQLTPRIAMGADLVLTMTRGHRDKVLELAPRLLNRTFTLSEAAHLASRDEVQGVGDLAGFRPQLFAEDLPDIADPIGQDVDVFRTVGLQIAGYLPPIVELFRRSADSARM